jgi:hypothetical protein
MMMHRSVSGSQSLLHALDVTTASLCKSQCVIVRVNSFCISKQRFDHIVRRFLLQAPNLDDKVDFHYVAFVAVDGTLYELDGRKTGPLKCGDTTPDTFLTDAARECRRYMERDPDNIHFTLMALAAAEQ